MATATYVPIATQTLSTAASSITFSSIPSTYTDLRIVIVGTTSSSSVNLNIQFNGETGASATTYSFTSITGNGSAAASHNATNTWSWVPTWVTGLQTSIPTFYTIDIFSYAGSTYKTGLMTTSTDINGSGSVERSVGLYRNTSSITSLSFTQTGSVTYSAGTTATLWGI